MKPRAGSYIYKDCEIPINAKIITDKNGRECYLSAICGDEATVRYIDNGEIIIVLYNRIKNNL